MVREGELGVLVADDEAPALRLPGIVLGRAGPSAKRTHSHLRSSRQCYYRGADGARERGPGIENASQLGA